MKNDRYISRPEAAKLLDVSLRTLDRYVRKKNMRTKRSGRNILIVREDILQMVKRPVLESEVVSSHNGSENTSEQRRNEIPSADLSTSGETNSVVRQFLEDYRQQLAAKDQKIEVLQYRVGELESQLKTSVPLLEHTTSASKKDKKLQESQMKVQNLETKYRAASFAKNLYIIILLVILIITSFSFLFVS